jgi:hypothetical protein
MLLGASTSYEDPPQSSFEASSDARSTLEEVHLGARRPAEGVTTSSTGPAATSKDVEALLGASRHPETEPPGHRGRQDESKVEEVLLGAPTRSDARPNGTEAR